MTTEQFFELSQNLKLMRDTDQRTKHQALAIYMYWLKTGLDQMTIATLFGINSQQDISRYLKQVRKCLYENFVPEFLGKYFKFKNNKNSTTVSKLENNLQ